MTGRFSVSCSPSKSPPTSTPGDSGRSAADALGHLGGSGSALQGNPLREDDAGGQCRRGQGDSGDEEVGGSGVDAGGCEAGRQSAYGVTSARFESFDCPNILARKDAADPIMGCTGAVTGRRPRLRA